MAEANAHSLAQYAKYQNKVGRSRATSEATGGR